MFSLGPQPAPSLKGVRFGSESVPNSEPDSDVGEELAWARAHLQKCRDEAEELRKKFGPRLDSPQGFPGQP